MKSKERLIAALKIWVVLYPSITLFFYFFGETLSVFPLYVRTLILTLTVVPWIVFVGVPFVDFMIKSLSPTMIKNNKDEREQSF
jgi:antibiotic biosynthesis monooxygenase (ABM) superfamily enzyme